MKKILLRLSKNESLDHNEAQKALIEITTGNTNDSEIAAFISFFLMRTPTLAELSGFRDAMLAQCRPVYMADFDAIDIVGTGGDGKNTFNISTLSAIVVAASGFQVIKHGNFASSSLSGSSDILQYLGYRFTADPQEIRKSVEDHNLCFLHAPLFHPAMKRVGQIRKDIGIHSFFNLLGPLSNPARPKRNLLGVNTLPIARLYHNLLQKTGNTYTIIHATDGYDEISLTGPVRFFSNRTEGVFDPEYLGFAKMEAHHLSAGQSIAQAAKIFTGVLDGSGSKETIDVVTANSGMAIHCFDPQKDIRDCIELARETLISRKAEQLFKKLTA